MRSRAAVLVMWFVMATAGVERDEEGAITDESLITAAWIVAGVAFAGFVTLKVIPWIRALNLPVVG